MCFIIKTNKFIYVCNVKIKEENKWKTVVYDILQAIFLKVVSCRER